MTTHDLLVISDLHLGEDLGAKTRRTEALEQALVDFLDYHREEGVSWRLVINGDMIELLGLMILPADVGDVGELHPDDHHYGLGGRAEAAVAKLAAVVRHQAPVFAALARFVGSGHALSVVIGNHDAELHWPAVQEVFVTALCQHWHHQRQSADPPAETLRDRVIFHPWFFHEAGMAWIEHGHQYDPYCSFEDVLEPATDDEEIDPNVGGLLVRYVCRQLEEDMHSAWGGTFFGYLWIWMRQGPRAIANVGVAYVDMCRRLVQHWRNRGPTRLAARRRRAALRRAKLATLRIPEAKLTELSRLWTPPVVVDLGRLVRAVMLDRLLVLIGAPLVFGAVFLLVPWSWQPSALAGLLPPLGVALWWAAQQREPVDRRAKMRATAARIRELVEVPFVVMGHSHDPCAVRDPEGAYLNTGTWVPHIDQRKAFTHVRIQRTPSGVIGRLCQWRDGASRIFDPETLG